MRTAETIRRLNAVQHELLQIKPARSVEAAWESIFAAVRRAEHGEAKPWTIEPLSASTITRYADGSVKVPLLAHWIYINRNGAIRIVDLWVEEALPFFEMNSATGVPFRMPGPNPTIPTDVNSRKIAALRFVNAGGIAMFAMVVLYIASSFESGHTMLASIGIDIGSPVVLIVWVLSFMSIVCGMVMAWRASSSVS